MSKLFRITAPTTRQEHENILHHCMSLIKSSEYNDGAGDMCDILHFNQIDTIIDIINIDNENLKAIHKILPDTKNRMHITMIHRNSVKLLQ